MPDSIPNLAAFPDWLSALPLSLEFRWSASLTSNSLVATLVWIAVMAALLIAGRSWGQLALSAFADRGLGFSRLIAWLVPSYVVWLLASLKLISFRPQWLLLSLFLFGGLGWLLARRFSVVESTSEDRRTAVGAEVVFWSVFALFLLFRLANPDSWHPVWGGEKPMEFAHINAILRTEHFPPVDPWFSGSALNYYYFGEYMVAALFKLTGIPSEIGFNLAQPMVMALLASAIYSVSATLAPRITTRSIRPRSAGFLTSLLVVGCGNLIAAKNIWQALPSAPHPSFVDWTWAASRAITGGITEFPYFTGLYADLHAHVIALPITVLVVALCLQWVLGRNTLTAGAVFEAFDVGDVRRAMAPYGRLKFSVTALLLALSLGSLGAANAWDVPVYACFVVAAAVTASGFPAFSKALAFWRNLSVNLLMGIAILGSAFLLFLPFQQHFHALYSSVGRVRAPTAPAEFGLHLGGLIAVVLIGLIALATKGILARPALSHQHHYMALIILVAATVGAAVGFLFLLSSHTVPWWQIALPIVIAIPPVFLLSFRFAKYWLTVSMLLLLPVSVAAVQGWTVLAIGTAIAGMGLILWLMSTETAERFLGIMLAAAGGAIAAVEMVYLVDDLDSLAVWYRMNTIFKIYNQLWILLGVSAGVFAAAFLLHGWQIRADRFSMSPHRDTDSDQPLTDGTATPHVVSQIGFMISIVVIVAGLLYPITSTLPRLDLRFPGHPNFSTLNALDWMRYGTLQTADGAIIRFNGDLDAINWFNASVPGSPVIVEASIGPYRGNGSRVSIATGLPAVIGWDRHERQQRASIGIAQRVADVSEIYNSTDPKRKLELLNKYDVAYVVVGDVERYSFRPGSDFEPYASEAGLATFESMVGNSLEIAFQSGDTVVYRVNQKKTS